jgi:hypothetical protein
MGVVLQVEVPSPVDTHSSRVCSTHLPHALGVGWSMSEGLLLTLLLVHVVEECYTPYVRSLNLATERLVCYDPSRGSCSTPSPQWLGWRAYIRCVRARHPWDTPGDAGYGRTVSITAHCYRPAHHGDPTVCTSSSPWYASVEHHDAYQGGTGFSQYRSQSWCLYLVC